MYNLNDRDLSYFINNAQLDTQPQNVNLIRSFWNDMKYNIIYGDKKSKRYFFIKDLINQYICIPTDPLSIIPIGKWNKIYTWTEQIFDLYRSKTCKSCGLCFSSI